MKTKNDSFAVRASVVAVQAALVAMAAMSAAQAADGDDAVRRLTQPTNVVEIGAGYVSQDSFKFGEYNGLNQKGIYGIFNFDLRGGGNYENGDPTRWRATGTDLGLDTREVTIEYGQQGRFRINFDYDELRRNRSDTYQTPYLGTGSDTLTLPSNWLKPFVPQVSGTNINFRSLSPTTGLASSNVGGVVTPPTAAQQTTVNNIIAADLPAFHNVDLDTKRTTYKGGFSYDIDPRWQFKVSAQHEKKDGLKPMGAVSSQVSEFAAILADPIDQTTDQYNVSLTYTGEKAFMQVAYYGSVFKNDISSLTWQDVNDPTKTATLSSAPSNSFHQILLTGGYNFSPTTKLVLNGSYGRNTQNDAFLTAGQNNQFPLGLPVSSLDGKVVTTAFNAKLTAKPIKDLNLVAGYKYDNRDNQTPVNTYFFQDANEARAAGASAFNAALGLPANTLGTNINIYANRPYSKKVNQFDVDADYAVAKGQRLQAGYEYQEIERKCDGSWINCADAPKTRENTLRAEWRANVVENLSGRVAYAYSERRVNYDENAFLALVPMANVVPAGGATVSAYQYLQQTGLTGFGPVAGFPSTPLTGNAAIFSPNNNILPQALYGSRNNINEEVGMRRFNMADRNRNKVRGSVNWDASDKLSLQGGLDYNKDDYDNSVYGLKNAETWALNLEGSYAVSSDFGCPGVLHARGHQVAERGHFVCRQQQHRVCRPGRQHDRVRRLFCDRGGQELQCENRPLFQLVDRHARQGGYFRRRLQVQEPDGRQAGSGWRSRLHPCADRHRRRGRVVCQQPLRSGGTRTCARSGGPGSVLHSRCQYADGHDQDDRVAAGRPVRDRQGVGASRAVLVPAPAVQRLCLRRHAVRDADQRDPDQRAAVQL